MFFYEIYNHGLATLYVQRSGGGAQWGTPPLHKQRTHSHLVGLYEQPGNVPSCEDENEFNGDNGNLVHIWYEGSPEKWFLFSNRGRLFTSHNGWAGNHQVPNGGGAFQIIANNQHGFSVDTADCTFVVGFDGETIPLGQAWSHARKGGGQLIPGCLVTRIHDHTSPKPVGMVVTVIEDPKGGNDMVTVEFPSGTTKPERASAFELV